MNTELIIQIFMWTCAFAVVLLFSLYFHELRATKKRARRLLEEAQRELQEEEERLRPTMTRFDPESQKDRIKYKIPEDRQKAYLKRHVSAHSAWVVYRALYEAGEPITSGDLARGLKYSADHTQVTLRYLELRGWAQRTLTNPNYWSVPQEKFQQPQLAI
jgi:hypothetical protein